jgi:hypothetical protein
MEGTHLNEKLIQAITEKLPDAIVPASYLMDLLCISKESVYRRLNNRIPFTFKEIALIANDLGLSVDTIIGQKKSDPIILEMMVDMTKNPSETTSDMLKSGIKVLRQLVAATDMNIIATINRIPLQYFPFQMLFKFGYCRYLHSRDSIPSDFKFADVRISSELEQLHKDSVYYFSRLRNITCIIDETLFSHLIKEIQYYHQRKFLTTEDLILLQKELRDFAGLIENLIKKGANNVGSAYTVYFSLFDLDANCIYYEYDDKKMSQLWIFPESPMIIREGSLMFHIQKQWLEARMKYATLITKSGDMVQAKLLRGLYSQVANMHP